MASNTVKATFEGADGDMLAAALEMPAGAPRAYALFAHCFSCSKDIKAARELSRALCASGIAVLRFDFTGLGASGGEFANTNFSSNVEDLVAAAAFLRREYEAPGLLIGHSLGGAAVIVAAEKIPEAKGVAVIGAPAEADHVVHQLGEKREEIERNGVAEVSLAGRPFTIKKQFLDDLADHNVLNAAAQLKRPLLVMHGPLDHTVGIENASQIFMAAKHPKSFVSLDQADHLLTKTEDAAYAAEVLAAWGSRYLDAPAPAVEAERFTGGALAKSVQEEPFAVALSVDGHPLISDASSDDGGADLGPNPTRILEGAVAACGVMTIKMYARRKGWPLEDAQIRIKRASGEDAHVARRLEKELTLIGPLDEEQRARLLEIADKCPVNRMVTEGVDVVSSLTPAA